MRHDKYPERNAKILAEKVAQYDAIEGPRIGDWVRLADGSFARLAEVNDSFFQCGVGSYYLHGSSCEFSGSFYFDCPSISILRQTGETRLGRIWFFNGNEVGPANGVDFEVEFRIFAIREDDDEHAKLDGFHEWVKRMGS